MAHPKINKRKRDNDQLNWLLVILAGAFILYIVGKALRWW